MRNLSNKKLQTLAKLCGGVAALMLVALLASHSGQIGILVRGGAPQAAAAAVYSYTGSVQTYTVPSGMTSIIVNLWGAGGEAT